MTKEKIGSYHRSQGPDLDIFKVEPGSAEDPIQQARIEALEEAQIVGDMEKVQRIQEEIEGVKIAVQEGTRIYVESEKEAVMVPNVIPTEKLDTE